MKLKALAILSIIAVTLALLGCKDLLTKHNIELGGVMHGKKLYRGAKDCTACHGITLEGNGPVAGCYDCHEALWDSDDHAKDRGGVIHKSGLRFSSDCVNCHSSSLGANDLMGSYSRPGCFDCHGDNWTDLEQRHQINNSGIMHGTNRDAPDVYCAGCHGVGLDGVDNIPGCYDCHYAHWIDTTDHNSMKYGVGHKNAPSTDCQACHGADLNGTKEAPSCYLCHGRKW